MSFAACACIRWQAAAQERRLRWSRGIGEDGAVEKKACVGERAERGFLERMVARWYPQTPPNDGLLRRMAKKIPRVVEKPMGPMFAMAKKIPLFVEQVMR